MSENTLGRTEVLNKGFVELVDMLPHPDTGIKADLSIVNAARTSFLGESKGDEQDKRLLRYLWKHEHMSPFEMVEFKFRIKAPVVVLWQLVRHRTANLNLQSGRYVEFEDSEFYLPDDSAWRKQSTDNKQGSSDESFSINEQNRIVNELFGVYSDNITDFFNWDDYQQAVGDDTFSNLFKAYYDLGHSIYRRLLDNGAAKEQARLFLPAWSTYYTAVVKFDARNFLHMLRLRLDNHAQYEIRLYAQAMLELVEPHFEWTIDLFKETLVNEKTKR